jgi:hypothetical protein
MLSQPALWQRIAQHPLGGQQQALFMRKLAQEQDWSADYCRQAMEEYRRFVYLACVSATPLSPSQAVDAVWHLHLGFSRDYWQLFCPQVLGRELHHDPDDGTDPAPMQDQYRATLALYLSEFDNPAPAAVWRQAAGNPPSRLAWLSALGALLAGGAALAAEDGAKSNHDGLIAVSAFAIVIYVIYRVFRPERRSRRKHRDSGSNCGSSCSTCSSASCGSSCGGGGD